MVTDTSLETTLTSSPLPSLPETVALSVAFCDAVHSISFSKEAPAPSSTPENATVPSLSVAVRPV